MNGSEITYRKAVLSDCKDISILDGICFEEDAESEREIYDAIILPEISYIVALQHGHIVGYIGYKCKDANSTIVNLAVHPDYRKQRMSNKLIALAEADMETNHMATSISLHSRVDNMAAIHIYEKLGYHIVKVLNKHYNSKDDAYLMIKTSLSNLLKLVTLESSASQLVCNDPRGKYSSISYAFDALKNVLTCAKKGLCNELEIIDLTP
jgi:ribosomal protein S18 acetylase RimI-like enzyme